jgi:hypothetical protein
MRKRIYEEILTGGPRALKTATDLVATGDPVKRSAGLLAIGAMALTPFAIEYGIRRAREEAGRVKRSLV